MKTLIIAAWAAFSLSLSASAADTSTKLTDVHLCCAGCVTGVEKAIGKVEGATAVVDDDAGTVTITAPDTKTVQKAADALVAAGYFGKSSDPSIKVVSDNGAKGKKVQSLKVKDVHLCCGKCVSVVNKALGTVTGVSGNTAAKGVKSFEVTGDFNDKEVFVALEKAGLAGKVE
ncbi:MAG: heavy-metal-associated domain-containing protein [Akkermansiaceae bacterium]|nr:heavy-metal-associated domain-containing protein [Verrucomicrobiales bacterium]